MLSIKKNFFLLGLLSFTSLSPMQHQIKPSNPHSIPCFTKSNDSHSSKQEPSFCYFAATCCIGYCATVNTVNGILYVCPHETLFAFAIGATAFIGAFTIGNEIRHVYLDYQSKKKKS